MLLQHANLELRQLGLGLALSRVLALEDGGAIGAAQVDDPLRTARVLVDPGGQVPSYPSAPAEAATRPDQTDFAPESPTR